MAQAIKCLTQLGATDFNGKAVDFGVAGSITTGSTGSITADGGTVTLGSTTNACTVSIPNGTLALGSTANTCATTIPNGSLTLGTSTVSVPLTLNGPTVEPSAGYHIITGTTLTGAQTAGVRGTIIAGANTSQPYSISLPSSPVDGQIYTVAFVATQTTCTITIPGTTPSLGTITPAAPTAYTFMYNLANTTWYVISA